MRNMKNNTVVEIRQDKVNKNAKIEKRDIVI